MGRTNQVGLYVAIAFAVIFAVCGPSTGQNNSPASAIFYVANIQPPDAYLALRTNPTSSFGQRIMAMPNGTLLQVLQRRLDGWWYVRVLSSGQEGWALSGQGGRVWIECCATGAIRETNSPQLYTPPIGSPERKSIMDSIRLARNSRTIFKVDHLIIARIGNRAIAVADISDVTRQSEDGGIFQLENLNSQWRTLYTVGGGGGADDCTTEAAIIKKMIEKAQEYSAPREIFPEAFWNIVSENKSADQCLGTVSREY